MNKEFNPLKYVCSTFIKIVIPVYNIVVQVSMMTSILYFPTARNFGIDYIIMLEALKCIFKESRLFESRIDTVYSSIVLISDYKKKYQMIIKKNVFFVICRIT